MNKTLAILSKTVVGIFLSSTLLTGAAQAKIVSHSKDIVVEQPSDLPELAQRAGIAFELYSGSGDGSTYLYIEQHRGERLVILDVTDPVHTKLVRAVALAVPGPFDFVRPLGSSALLIRFRNNEGVAVLDLGKAKAPALKTVNGIELSDRAEPLGEASLLVVKENHNESRLAGQRIPQDYQVVDTFNPAKPVLLDTVRLVTDKTTRDETGTTFLLGSEGLTIIRRPRVEEEYQIQQDSMRN